MHTSMPNPLDTCYKSPSLDLYRSPNLPDTKESSQVIFHIYHFLGNFVIFDVFLEFI